MFTLPVILIWGLGGFAIHPAQQARLVTIAPDLATASAALNLSGTYLGQMLGGVSLGCPVSRVVLCLPRDSVAACTSDVHELRIDAQSIADETGIT